MGVEHTEVVDGQLISGPLLGGGKAWAQEWAAVRNAMRVAVPYGAHDLGQRDAHIGLAWGYGQ